MGQWVREGVAGCSDTWDLWLRRPKLLSSDGVICSSILLFAVRRWGTRVHRASRRAKATCTATPCPPPRVAPMNTCLPGQGSCTMPQLVGPSNTAR